MRKRVLIALALVVLGALMGPTAAGGSNSVVVSEIYGGGGNASATYRYDYVELFNATRQPVSLSGWKLEYSSASSDTWTSVSLAGTISAFKYFLLRLGSGGTAGGTLPTPDQTSSLNIAASAGDIRLVNQSTVVDVVGYGAGADIFETRPAAAPTDATQSVTRTGGGCDDTNDNAVDFALRAPTPRNRASAGLYCGQAPVLAPVGEQVAYANEQLAFTITASDTDGDPLSYSATNVPTGASFTRETRTFAWTPTADDVGVYPDVRFAVSDGFASDSEVVKITVFAERSATTLHAYRESGRIYTDGAVMPRRPGQSVIVDLYQWGGRNWRRLASKTAALDWMSEFETSFNRPSPGRCAVVATYPGDSRTGPSWAEVRLDC